MRKKTEIRIFVSSPTDVKTLRKTALKMIKEINEKEADTFDLSLKAFDQDFISPDIDNGKIPQRVINNDSNFTSIDLLIVIFWRSIGKPTGEDISGTVQEFNEAYDRFKRDKSPTINVYFKTIESNCKDAPCSRIKKLLKFQKELGKKGVLWCEFDEDSEFEVRFKRNILTFLKKQADKIRIGSIVQQWHDFSGAPDNVTDSGYTYIFEGVPITLKKMEFLSKMNEQLMKDKGIIAESTCHLELYRIYREYGDLDTAKIHLEKAQEVRKKSYVEIYDESGKPTNHAQTQYEVHKNGTLHALCHTFVLVNNTHIYLQKRSHKKNINPNKWTSSSCGHVRNGESPIKASRREIVEELSSSIMGDIHELGSVRVSSEYVENELHIRCEAFAYVFCIEMNKELDIDFINKEEISQIMLMTPEAVKEMVDGKRESLDFAPNFPKIFDCFLTWFNINKKG